MRKQLALLSILLTFPLASHAELNLESMDQQIRQLLQQLKPQHIASLGPYIDQYRNCIVDQQLIDEDGLNISRIFSAKKACDPVLNELFDSLGLKTEQQREEAISEVYKKLLEDSI